jgi:hypothetical protein
MRQSYPWEGKQSRRAIFVKYNAVGYIAFGLLFLLVGWLTSRFTASYGWLFVAYGFGYYFGASGAFRRVEQN